MIRLEYLAMRINELLGTDKYCVYLNSNAFPEDIGERTVVTMNVMRVPFGFSTEEFDAESMTITLTFDLPCDAYGDELVIRDGALAHIQETLLGHKTFNVLVEDKEFYTVNMYLEQQIPGNPYVDSGRITQQIVLSGSALVQNTQCGAIVGNDVKVFIDDAELLKISRVSNIQIGADNNIPLSEGKTVPEMQAISRIAAKTLDFLYTGKEIEDEFLKIAEGVSYDINRIFKYKVQYPNFYIETPIKITGVSTQDAPSKFLQYTIAVQVVGDAEVVNV